MKKGTKRLLATLYSILLVGALSLVTYTTFVPETTLSLNLSTLTGDTYVIKKEIKELTIYEDPSSEYNVLTTSIKLEDNRTSDFNLKINEGVYKYNGTSLIFIDLSSNNNYKNRITFNGKVSLIGLNTNTTGVGICPLAGNNLTLAMSDTVKFIGGDGNLLIDSYSEKAKSATNQDNDEATNKLCDASDGSTGYVGINGAPGISTNTSITLASYKYDTNGNKSINYDNFSLKSGNGSNGGVGQDGGDGLVEYNEEDTSSSRDIYVGASGRGGYGGSGGNSGYTNLSFVDEDNNMIKSTLLSNYSRNAYGGLIGKSGKDGSLGSYASSYYSYIGSVRSDKRELSTSTIGQSEDTFIGSYVYPYNGLITLEGK